MSSEVSYSTVAELRTANSALRTEVRQLKAELMTAITQQEQRNIERVSGIELWAIKWGTQILAMSIAFTLLIAFIAKHEIGTTGETAIATPQSTD